MSNPIGQKGLLVKRSLGPKSQVPDPKSNILNPRFQIQILKPNFRIPGRGGGGDASDGDDCGGSVDGSGGSLVLIMKPPKPG